MKFKTQHINPKGKPYKVHRDGNTTWLTTGDRNAVSEVTQHATRAKAAAYMLSMGR